MSKHTPGPWTQATHSPTDVVADGGTMVAMARDGLNGIARDQAVVNARLIAASPSMLVALQRLTHPMADDGDIEFALAVIARAAGG